MTQSSTDSSLVDRLREGPIRTGDTEDGEYELFDVEEAAQTMHEAADRISTLERELVDADSLVDKATAWDAIAEKNARIATLTEKVARMGEALEQLVPFAKWAIRESAFSGHELDGGEVQEKALAHCLIVRTVYDPQQHGPSDVASAGDEWFEFSSTIAEPRP
jgi:hypothetical protein